MNFVNTLIVDGQPYTVQDPNAVTPKQLEDALSALPGNNGNTDFSWTSIINTTLTENMLAPPYLYRCMWEFDEETTAKIREMTEFKLLIKLPFTEEISAGDFEVKAFFADEHSVVSGMLCSRATIAVPAGSQQIIALKASKIADVLFAVMRQSTGHSGAINTLSETPLHNNVFDVDKLWFKFNLTNKYPLPIGTRVVLEGR